MASVTALDVDAVPAPVRNRVAVYANAYDASLNLPDGYFRPPGWDVDFLFFGTKKDRTAPRGAGAMEASISSETRVATSTTACADKRSVSVLSFVRRAIRHDIKAEIRGVGGRKTPRGNVWG